MGLDALVVIGGDGTLAIAHEFHKRGIPIVGVPKTIDNDIVETTMTFGFDTAVAFATDAIDRLHTTAEAHHRVMVVEVMGRYAGWIALYAGIAGGADVVLIPEIPFDLDEGRRAHPRARALGRALQHRRRRRGRARRSAARARSSRPGTAHRVERLGGIGERVSRRNSSELTGKEARHVVLGHLQRGGSPTAYDRVLATRFGSFAVELHPARRVRRDDRAAARRTSSRCRSSASSASTRNGARATATSCAPRGTSGFRFGD